jgi:hypothetical protein
MRSVLVVLLFLLAVAVPACSSPSAPPDPCITDPVGCTCTGQCAPLRGSSGRALLWSGPEGTTPPACPSAAATFLGAGYLDALPSMITCSGTCTCSTSNGGCAPALAMSAHNTVCPAAGPGVPFNAPETWDGSCTTMDSLSSAASLTVQPPFSPSSQDICEPSLINVVTFQGGTTVAELCITQGTGVGDLPGGCPSGEVCTFPNVPGFSICTYAVGDQPCPDGWPTKHLYFDRGSGCSCSCGPPMGEVCTSTVTVYEDTACTKPVGSVMAASDTPAACVDISPTSTLGSKSATAVFTAGTCKPMLMMAASTTLCCLP